MVSYVLQSNYEKSQQGFFPPFFFAMTSARENQSFFDPFVELFISMKIDSYIPSKSCLTYFI